MIKDWLVFLKTPDSMWRPFAFDQVIIMGRSEQLGAVEFGIVGVCYSEFESGPNLLHLANVAGGLVGPGCYGLKSARLIARANGANYETIS